MKKPQVKNLFFIIPIIIISINYILLGVSYYIQNNTGWNNHGNIFNLEGLEAWNTAISISGMSFYLVFILLILSIIFAFVKKINLLEFIIWFLMNLVALYFCLMVIADRI